MHDRAGRVLLVRRGHEPSLGLWSIPGGRCHAGEAAEAACVRELAEETGLEVVIARWAGRVERAVPSGAGTPGTPAGAVYVIDDFVCEVVGGTLRAGDDATDARWVSRAELGRPDPLAVAPGVVDALGGWDLLPR